MRKLIQICIVNKLIVFETITHEVLNVIGQSVLSEAVGDRLGGYSLVIELEHLTL